MSKSQFMLVRISIDTRFGNVKYQQWYDAVSYSNSQVKKAKETYLKHEYIPILADVWIGATIDNRPIISCQVFSTGKEFDLMLFVRIE